MAGKVVSSSLAIYNDFAKAFQDITSKNQQLSNDGIKSLQASLQESLKKRKESKLSVALNKSGADPTLCDDFDYVITELAKSLLTNPSPGVLIALKEVLAEYPNDPSKVIKAILSKEFSTSDKSVQEEVLQARVFLLLALIKSKKIQHIKDISLIEISAQELLQGLSTALRAKCLDGLLGLFESIKYTTFLQKVLPQLVTALKNKWTADMAIFVVKLTTIFKELDLVQYSKHLSNRLVIHPAHTKLLGDILIGAGKSGQELYELILKNSETLPTEQRDSLLTGIWTHQHTKSAASPVELLSYLHEILPKVSPQARSKLLTPSVISALRDTNNTSGEQASMHSSIIEALKEAAADSDVAATLFDKEIDLVVSPTIAVSIASGLFSTFQSSPTSESLNSLVRLVKVSANTADFGKWNQFVSDVLCTLYALSYWQLSKLDGKKKELPQFLIKMGNCKLEDEPRKLCASAFARILDSAIWRTEGKSGQLSTLKNGLERLYAIGKLQQSLLSSKQAVLVQPLPEDALSTCSEAWKNIEAINSLGESATKQQLSFQLLLLSILVQLFAGEEDTPGQLFDVVQCYSSIFPAAQSKKAAKNAKPEADNKTEALVVLMEVLLSQKTITPKSLQWVPECVAGAFASELPVEALQVCVEALVPDAGKEEEFDSDVEVLSENENEDADGHDHDHDHDHDHSDSGDEDEEEDEGEESDEGEQESEGAESMQDDESDAEPTEEELKALAQLAKEYRPKKQDKDATKKFRQNIMKILRAYLKKTTNASTLVDFAVSILKTLNDISPPLLADVSPYATELATEMKKLHFPTTELNVTTLRNQLATLQQMVLEGKTKRFDRLSLDFVLFVMKLLISVKTDNKMCGALDVQKANKFILQFTGEGSNKSNEAAAHLWTGIDSYCPELMLEGGMFENLLANSLHQARGVVSHLGSSPDRLRALCKRVVTAFGNQKPKLAFILFMRSCFDKLAASVGRPEAQKVFAESVSKLQECVNDAVAPKKLRNNAQQLVATFSKSAESSKKPQTNNKPQTNSKSKTSNKSQTNKKPKTTEQEQQKPTKRKADNIETQTTTAKKQKSKSVPTKNSTTRNK